MMAHRLRIAWFSPLRNERDDSDGIASSKAAHASAVLLPQLEKWCDIDLFHDQLTVYRGRPVHPHLRAVEIHEKNPYHVFLYHLEDGRQSYFSRIHAALIPGIVWFHDFFLSDFGPEPILNSAWRDTVSKFKDRSLSWTPHNKEHDPIGPQAYREAGMAAIKVFSSERDHIEYLRSVDLSLTNMSSRSYYLPLPIVKSSADKRGGTEILEIVFCGTPQIEHRAHVLLEALSRTGGEWRLRWLIAQEEELLARQLIEEFDIHSVELIIGRSPETWTRLVHTSSLAIHTLFSVYGQLGPYLNISLGAGTPCVVCNFGQGELLPSSLVLKISCGDKAALELEQIILSAQQGIFEPLRKRISTYGMELFDANTVAQELYLLMDNSRHTLQKCMNDWRLFENEARAQLSWEAHQLLSADLLGTSQFDQVFQELGWS